MERAESGETQPHAVYCTHNASAIILAGVAYSDKRAQVRYSPANIRASKRAMQPIVSSVRFSTIWVSSMPALQNFKADEWHAFLLGIKVLVIDLPPNSGYAVHVALTEEVHRSPHAKSAKN